MKCLLLIIVQIESSITFTNKTPTEPLFAQHLPKKIAHTLAGVMTVETTCLLRIYEYEYEYECDCTEQTMTFVRERSQMR